MKKELQEKIDRLVEINNSPATSFKGHLESLVEYAYTLWGYDEALKHNN